MQSVVPQVSWRSLLPGQVSQLCIADSVDGSVEVVLEDRERVIEAPNWTPDGEGFVVNAAGNLYRIPVGGSSMRQLDTGALRDHNNDHVVSRDGATIFSSSEGSGHVYAVPIDGGEPTRISNDRPGIFSYFLQGISPDGTTLSYAGAEYSEHGPRLNLFELPSGGGADRQLTDWSSQSIGGDYSPDGKWLYFNSEIHSERPGHAQLFRRRMDDGQLEQLTFDERVNWFPKVSPLEPTVVYLSFPPGSIGHPANLDVEIRRMNPDGTDARTLLTLFGGQGTMNINSWAPDGRRFAFVRYPVDA